MKGKKKSIAMRLGRTFLITLVVGNAIAMFSGANPIDFERYDVAGPELNSLETLKKLHKDDSKNPEYAVGLGMLYFLNNHLDEAEEVTSAIGASHLEEPNVKSLVNAIRIKRAAEMLDLLFGQVKLHRIKEAANEVYLAAEEQPDSIPLQVLALGTLVPLTDIGGSLTKGLIIGERLEKQLNSFEANNTPVPTDLAASSWLTIADLYLTLINEKGESEAYVNTAKIAWGNFNKNFKELSHTPEWFLDEKKLVASKLHLIN